MFPDLTVSENIFMGHRNRGRVMNWRRLRRDAREVLRALEQDDREPAFELLLEAILAAEGDERERLINLTVGLFGELGHEHPLTMRYRRRLAASLY